MWAQIMAKHPDETFAAFYQRKATGLPYSSETATKKKALQEAARAAREAAEDASLRARHVALVARREALVAQFRTKFQAPASIDIPPDAVICVLGTGGYDGFYRKWAGKVDRGWDLSSPAGRFGTEYGYEMCGGNLQLRYDYDEYEYQAWKYQAARDGYARDYSLSQSSLHIVKKSEWEQW
jgi:type II secretory pathway pseudopilin PulG